MKKLLYIEIVLVAVLLGVAIFRNQEQIQGWFGGLTAQVSQFSTPSSTATQPSLTTPPTTTAPPETTVPPTTAPPETTEPTETTFPGPEWMVFAPDRELTAQCWFVYDNDTDDFLLLSGDPEEAIYPASVTKLFTAYVALQYLEPQETVTVGEALDLVDPTSSIAGLGYGDTLTIGQLLEGMLLPSGNDAAYVMAAAAGRVIDGDPEEYAWNAVMTFLDEMNRQAQELGLSGTHFVNPDGIQDDNHYTCPADLTVIAHLAMQNDLIMRCAGMSRKTMYLDSHGEEVEWKNTNRLIDPESDYYCPYAIGLKTGQTYAAGSCLLSAFDYHGRSLIIGVFGCPEEEDRFADTLQLLTLALEKA